jgi:hypothetical protein
MCQDVDVRELLLQAGLVFCPDAEAKDKVKPDTF